MCYYERFCYPACFTMIDISESKARTFVSRMNIKRYYRFSVPCFFFTLIDTCKHFVARFPFSRIFKHAEGKNKRRGVSRGL